MNLTDKRQTVKDDLEKMKLEGLFDFFTYQKLVWTQKSEKKNILLFVTGGRVEWGSRGV